MKKINFKKRIWEYNYNDLTMGKLDEIERTIEIAESINSIIDYLENDLDKKLKKIIEKEIENRFEILDL